MPFSGVSNYPAMLDTQATYCHTELFSAHYNLHLLKVKYVQKIVDKPTRIEMKIDAATIKPPTLARLGIPKTSAIVFL